MNGQSINCCLEGNDFSCRLILESSRQSLRRIALSCIGRVFVIMLKRMYVLCMREEI